MAIHHALSEELIDIKPLGEALKATQTTTLSASSRCNASKAEAASNFPSAPRGTSCGPAT